MASSPWNPEPSRWRTLAYAVGWVLAAFATADGVIDLVDRFV
jgi:hypothetical protein